MPTLQTFYNNPTVTIKQSPLALTWSSGVTIDHSNHNVFTLSVGTTGTISHTNVPPGSARYGFELHLNWTAGSITWPGNWTGDTPPSATGDYVITGVTIDGGTTWKIAVLDASTTYDADALTYIQAVEAADGQSLETNVRVAINNFVVGCKSDGIWDAIKASCILAGARTLSGALAPLVGTAPTNNNFVSGDYNRKTGLVGNGSSKYLDSNRANSADPQNNQHMAVYATTLGAVATGYIGSGAGATTGISQIYVSTGNIFASRSQTSTLYSGSTQATGLLGISRSASGSYSARNSGSTATPTATSQAPNTAKIIVYNLPTLSYYSAARLSFYSIGEALDLEKLDNRVTALMNAFNQYIA